MTKNSMLKDAIMGTSEISMEKVEMFKARKKRKTKIWLSFLFFGWSYGSLGSLDKQILWYITTAVTAFGLYENYRTDNFTILTSLALVGLPIWVIWTMFRLVTLNKEIEKYNQRLIDIFDLNQEEKALLDI
jgi:hypothetical protein